MPLIKDDFPLEEVNRLAREERKGGTTRPDFEPLMYLHKWWARRLGSVFRTLLLYTLVDSGTKVRKKDDQWRIISPKELANPWLLYPRDIDLGQKVVLDPFMGSGITAIKALSLGCRVVAQDLNPIAWFMVKVALSRIKVEDLMVAFGSLEHAVANDIRTYYRTACPTCLENWANAHNRSRADVEDEICSRILQGEDLAALFNEYRSEVPDEEGESGTIFAETIYYFWVKEVTCEQCGRTVPLFKSYMFAHKRCGRRTIGYYVTCPSCKDILLVSKIEDDVTCPSCHRKFHPQRGPVNRNGNKFTCPKRTCHATSNIVDYVRRFGKPKEKMYALHSFCPQCQVKQFTPPGPIDLALFHRAEQDLEKDWENIVGKYIPDTIIPPGFNTKQAMNHGYALWRDMFNARQLMVLAMLLRGIMSLECSEAVKEFLLLTFSKSLEYCNMLCEYHRINNYVYNLFKTHAFHPPLLPVESNLWGGKFGFGTFRNLFAANAQYKKFNTAPYIKWFSNSGSLEKKFSKCPIIAQFGDIFTDPSANALILQGDSRELPAPDKSIDAVITDPPFFDNVMYSELSDFYYAWLHMVLKEKYSEFRGDRVPNDAEIIVNPGQNKDAQTYQDGLTCVFKEIKRVLKTGGVVVFPFHHQHDRAWETLLHAILNAGLYIAATHVVLTEMSTAVPILNKKNPQCDIILVCCQREAISFPRQWSELQTEMQDAIQDSCQRLIQSGNVITREDLRVIASGKCLEIYSQYFPEIYCGEMKMGISSALAAIREIADMCLDSLPVSSRP